MFLNNYTGEIIINAYAVNYLLNGKCVDNLPYTTLSIAIKDALYYLKSLSHKVDQIKIYKNGILIAELNKWKEVKTKCLLKL